MDITPDLGPNCLLGRQTTSSSQPSPGHAALSLFRRNGPTGPAAPVDPAQDHSQEPISPRLDQLRNERRSQGSNRRRVPALAG
jgi:hypothetical protein